MAQQVVHARVVFGTTNQYLDPSTNDFYFEATGAGPTIDFDALLGPTQVITAFYNAVAAGSPQAVHTYMAGDIDRTSNASLIEYYDVTNHLDGTPAGSPIRQDMFTLSPSGGGGSLPPGVAACVGYRADYGGSPEFTPGSRPRARLRGRFFVGPLAQPAIQSSGGLLAVSFLEALQLSFSAMATTKNQGETNQFNLVQWSRRGQHVHQITNYYVDEACCYQRRRADDTANRVHDWTPVGS